MSYDAPPPSAVPPPPPPPAPGAGQPAELLDRFVARLIDGVLIAVVAVPIVMIFAVATVFSSGSGWLTSIISSVLYAALGLGYFGFMESSRGQTVGKMVMKLRTQGPGGELPTMEQALKRNAWMALSLIGILPFLGGFLSSIAYLAAVITIALGINNNTATRQAWHDNFAGGTQVIKVG